MTGASTEIEIRPMERTEADLEAIGRCFEVNGIPKELDQLRWQYFEAPGGRVYVDLAHGTDPETGEPVLAAIYAVFQVFAEVGGRTVPAVQSFDTITDHRFRGRGLFKQLAASVYERVAADGNALVYGFPNGNSAHGIFRRLGWTAVDPVPMLARPLRTGPILKWTGKLAPLGRVFDVRLPVRRHRLQGRHVELVEVDHFDERFTELWDRFSERIPVAIRRDEAYLNWRLSKPGVGYRTLEGLLGGKLAGFVSWRQREVGSDQVGYLMELVVDPDSRWVARVLLAAALREMRDAGVALVQGMSLPTGPLHSAWLAEGFLPLPQRLWRTELHVGARGFTDQARALVTDRKNWYFSLCDSDTL